MIDRIKKRNGEVVDFNQDKITNAIYAAAQAVAEKEKREVDYSIAQRVSDRIAGQLEMMFNGNVSPTVEQIQDLVERRLMEDGFADTAKEYILYREKHKEKRELDATGEAVFNFTKSLVGGFISNNDWRTQENANSSSGNVTFQGTNARLAGELWNKWALYEMYGKEDSKIRTLHESRAFHIHDLDFPTVAYCCGHSLKELIKRGFGDVPMRIQSSPAKHLETLALQMVNYIGCLQMEFAGAQALLLILIWRRL